MINTQLVRDKLENIKFYYKELEVIFKHPLKEIKQDFVKYHATERILQLIVDEIIDINNHVISRQDFTSPDDFQGTFQILANNNVLPENFAERIAPVIGLRNHLVHRYEKINRSLVLEQIQKEREDFKEYVALIEKYLQAR